MATLKISLSDLPPDAVDVTDLSALPKAELMARLQDLYAFLGPDAEIAVDEGTVSITLPDPSGYQRAAAERAFQSAMKAGERGDNARAIRLLEQVLVTLPAHTSARRNLAMAHLESGDPETAKRLVIETLRLDPKDAWAHLLLGNIYAKHEEDLDRAEACYKRAAELSPRDAFILTNYGALMTERGRTEEADDLFLRAIHEDPTYPNAYYALALHAYNTGDPARATATLENMFEIVKAPTPRTEALFTESRSLYLHACVDLARQRHDELMALVEQRRQELESAGDYPIRLEEDASLQVPATSQMAWKHARDHHNDPLCGPRPEHHAPSSDARTRTHRDGASRPRRGQEPLLRDDCRQPRSRGAVDCRPHRPAEAAGHL
ncbi:MAG: tetratricopeptide repeat protein [Anaerolineales bacterium]|nr:tetratricopeptide repeat protein [Anaerolineales bacterium]